MTEYKVGVDNRAKLIVHLSEVNTLWLHTRAFVRLTAQVPHQLSCANRCKAASYVADASHMWTTAELPEDAFCREVWSAISDGEGTIDKTWREVFRSEATTTLAREFCRTHKMHSGVSDGVGVIFDRTIPGLIRIALVA